MRELLELVAGIFDGLRVEAQLPPAESVEFFIADDISSAVQQQAGSFVGVEDLQNFDAERIGGQVVGKTLFRDEQHRRIVIFMSGGTFEAEDGPSKAVEIYLVAHEMAHGLIGQLRSASGPPMPPTFLPWGITRWFARYALEEYVADSLAEVALRQFGFVTDDEGERHPLSARVVLPRGPHFMEACADRLAGLVDRIHQYRIDGHLNELWLDVQNSTGQLFVTVAHAQAELDDPTGEVGPVVTADQAEAFGPLHDCWEQMHSRFASIPLLATSERFAEIEPAVLDDAGELILEFWRDLGLTFRPEGDAFHIEVASPDRSWSPPG